MTCQRPPLNLGVTPCRLTSCSLQAASCSTVPCRQLYCSWPLPWQPACMQCALHMHPHHSLDSLVATQSTVNRAEAGVEAHCARMFQTIGSCRFAPIQHPNSYLHAAALPQQVADRCHTVFETPTSTEVPESTEVMMHQKHRPNPQRIEAKTERRNCKLCREHTQAKPLTQCNDPAQQRQQHHKAGRGKADARGSMHLSLTPIIPPIKTRTSQDPPPS